MIAGQGKTGTTALFFKIQQALPADTWCLFEPRTYEARAGHAGHVLAKVLIGFGRSVDVESFHGFDKKIILTRDPRDTLVSRVLYDIYNEPAICADAAKVASFMDLLRRKEADPRGTPLVDLIDLFDGMSRRAMRPRATEDPGVALEFQRSHPDYVRVPIREPRPRRFLGRRVLPRVPGGPGLGVGAGRVRARGANEELRELAILADAA